MKQKKSTVTPPSSFETRRKLSPLRLFIAVLLLAVLGYALYFNWQNWQIKKSVATLEPWFAAYVDVTSTPLYAFEELGSGPHPSVVLSFIVSSHDDPCTPSWGGYYTMSEASTELDLDRRIARLQQQDGRVAVSFGGALNDELALNCTDKEQLVSAYRSVIERYHIDTIDLDLENESLQNTEAAERRAQAIAQLQRERREEGKSLAVWLTLPVSPQGLTSDGTHAVAQMLENGVDLAGVNVMTMNYSSSRPEGHSMLEASQDALVETHRQLGVLYNQAEITLNSTTLWRKIGATPMIGQNDIVTEVFTQDDAVGLNAFAQKHGVGRMSLWSANRDRPCGDNYVDLKIVSDSCSGVETDELGFSAALSEGFDGDLTQNSQIITIEDQEATVQLEDDPETSPYQIWQETATYLAGVKVVWHGNVYEAKWWNTGEVPNNPVLQSWETPWKLIGPVLPGEKPVEQVTLPLGTYEEWSGSAIYQADDRVLFEGVPFQAKWWNQGQSPAAASANADSSPWVALTHAEIKQLLNELE